MKDYMTVQVKPHENKRLHNKGMKNLKRLVTSHRIAINIEFIGGRIIN